MSKLRIAAERKITGSFVLMIIVLLALSVLSYLNSKRYLKANEWVTHTNEVLYHSEQILSSAIDLETGQRGYLITGDRNFLEHYEVAKINIREHLANLKKATSDNPTQQRRIDTLTELTNRRMQLLTKLIAIRDKNTSITKIMTGMSYESKSLLDKFRVVLRNSQNEEKKLLNIRLQNNQRESVLFMSTLSVLIIAILAILGFSFLVIRQHLALREQNEKTIKKNWKMLQSILDNTNAVIYIKDLNGKYLLTNKKFASHFNMQPEDMIGKTSADLVDKETAQKLAEKDKQVIEAQTSIEYEDTILYEDAKFVSITSKFPLKDEQGAVYALCGIVTDISEIKKNEEKLHYQSYMIHNASDAFIGSDLDYTITFWNKSSEELYGFTSEQAIGKKVFELLNRNKKAPENIGQLILAQLVEHGKWEGEFDYETENGRTIPISTSTSLIKDKDGKPIGILAVNRDISVQKKQQEDILQLNKELEAFTYSVSHDLRAPLRSIDGYSRILLEDYYNILDNEGKKVIKTIVNNSVRMGKLIDDLLAFSRLSRQHLYQKRVNMNDIVQLALSEFENGINLRIAQLSIQELPYAKGDINMLRQVWTNLISNALKYSSKKERPFIEIGSYSETNYQVYYVKDNGTGFDMQYVHKLFGVFQRLHRLEDFEGTGVGLALVHRIISKHEGKVWAEGKVGEGATFYFSLPKE